jgi:threonyl-tRNA synthetase
VDNDIAQISFPLDKLLPRAPSMKDHKAGQKKKVDGCIGHFPLWLSPQHVRVLPISADAKVLDCSISTLNELRRHQVRAENRQHQR